MVSLFSFHSESDGGAWGQGGESYWVFLCLSVSISLIAPCLGGGNVFSQGQLEAGI